jgi:hypothetical protein
VPELSEIAVDWSGARRPKGIWLAAVRGGELVESRSCATREEAVERVLATPSPVVAGFDFSFSVPAWFARELACDTVFDVWVRAESEGDTWLAPTPPFWRTRCDVAPERRFRTCERRFPTAKSVFQLVGNGQVGAGSVRGMPFLAQLRAAGFAIWPFDAASDRTALEIYPSALRPNAPPLGPFASNDERDAVCSAFVMWQHRHLLAGLAQGRDPETQIEGDVWLPPASPPVSVSRQRPD